MKRVSLLLMLGSFLFATTGHAQTFTSLIADASGDYNSGGVTIADIKELSYRVNTAGDSIWFKIDTYNDMLSNSDFGFMFGIDTNLVTTNGTAWSGTNSSMHYDHALFFMQNGLMQPGIVYAELGNVGAALPFNVSIQKPNNKTLIAGMKSAPIDNNGNFNLVFGSGFFDVSMTGSVFDEAPGTTYLQVRKNKAGITEVTAVRMFNVYPNPAADRICWDTSAMQKAARGSILDVTGKMVASFDMADGAADISRLEPGTYMLHTGTSAAMFVKK